MKQPLAYVHPEANVAENVVIEPFVTINKDVVIGEGTWIGSNATIMPGVRIGKNCRIFPGEGRCGYYDFLSFERAGQEDETYISTTDHSDN